MRTYLLACLFLLGLSTSFSQDSRQLLHPEHLAGRWESPDGQGGEVGMNISLTTTLASSTMDLVGVSQTLSNLVIGIYRRSASNAHQFRYNFFTTSANGGADWDGQHLRIAVQHKPGFPAVHVDLVWHERARIWTGVFERGAFGNQTITLRRPTWKRNNPFVGTWFDSGALMNNCLHISQEEDGTLTGWGDDIQIPGRMRYANGIRPPGKSVEHYGEIAEVKVTEPDQIEVELRAYIPACCSHLFIARISRNGHSLRGTWLSAPNQMPPSVKWIRVQGDSCASAAGHR